MTVVATHPTLAPDYIAAATRRAVQTTLTQIHNTPPRETHPLIPQWILVLRHALPHTALWSHTRDLLFALSDVLERTARHDELIALLDAGLNQSKNVADTDTHAFLQIKLAPLIMARAESDRAYTLLTNAYDYFVAKEDSLHQGQALNGLARWASQRGELITATIFIGDALTIIPEDAFNDRAVSYRLIGGNAVDRQEWQNAYEAHQESLRLWQLGGNPRFIGFGWVNVGSTLRGLGRYEEAVAAFREGIQRFEDVQDLVNRALAQMNLGNLYSLRAQYYEAIDQYHAAETVFRQLNRISDLARLYNNWGMAYAGLKWWEQAMRAYEQSIGYWETLQNEQQKANVMDNLGLTLFGMGQYAESANVYRMGLAELSKIEDNKDPILHNDLLTHLAEAESKLTAT